MVGEALLTELAKRGGGERLRSGQAGRQLVSEFRTPVYEGDDVVEVEAAEHIALAATAPRRELRRDQRGWVSGTNDGAGFECSLDGGLIAVSYHSFENPSTSSDTRMTSITSRDSRWRQRQIAGSSMASLEAALAQPLPEPLVLGASGDAADDVDVIGSPRWRRGRIVEPKMNGRAADEDDLSHQWPEMSAASSSCSALISEPVPASPGGL